MRGKGAEARRYQHQSTYYNKYYANERGQFLHKNVKFQAKLRNNYELCIKNYELFCTFAPAFCKNNIYLLIKSSMNQYETVFILTPVLSDEQTKETVAKFKKVLTDKGAEILNEEAWGLKKMAQP